MDGTRSLFQKIRGRDRDSFEKLSEAYGWKLYAHIRSSTPDREQADRIFAETFPVFYDMVESYEGDDPIEAMLFSCADRACRAQALSAREKQNLGPWTIAHEAGFSLPPVEEKLFKKEKEPLFLRIFYGLCILILIAGIAAAVWIMLWMLMSMNLIPSLDLGYSWFNANIADLF